MKNKKTFDEIINFIENNPQHWEQESWHCGTTHCIAGFVQCKNRGVPYCQELEVATKGAAIEGSAAGWWVDRSGGKFDGLNPAEEGMQFFDLTLHEGDWLFSAERTLEELRHVRDHGLESAMEVYYREDE